MGVCPDTAGAAVYMMGGCPYTAGSAVYMTAACPYTAGAAMYMIAACPHTAGAAIYMMGVWRCCLANRSVRGAATGTQHGVRSVFARQLLLVCRYSGCARTSNSRCVSSGRGAQLEKSRAHKRAAWLRKDNVVATFSVSKQREVPLVHFGINIL